jgi:hypothetical protein
MATGTIVSHPDTHDTWIARVVFPLVVTASGSGRSPSCVPDSRLVSKAR